MGHVILHNLVFNSADYKNKILYIAYENTISKSSVDNKVGYLQIHGVNKQEPDHATSRVHLWHRQLSVVHVPM